ncbi:tetratricopeptide repeat protein [Actinocorallia libanotica]
MAVEGLVKSLSGQDAQAPHAPDGWAEFLSPPEQRGEQASLQGDPSKVVRDLVGPRNMGRVHDWVMLAPIEDVVSWIPPTRGVVFDGTDADDQEVRNTAIWLVDRFGEADVKDWQLSSLHLEWLYLHGRKPVPIVNAAMAERRVDSLEVAKEIANETTLKWNNRKEEGLQISPSTFVEPAIRYLQEGQHEAAIALFATLTALFPHNSEAQNNLGFCMMPANAPLALEAFERAEALSGEISLMTLANRALALHLLGRDGEAHSILISDIAMNTASSQSWVWEPNEDHSLALAGPISVPAYMESLRSHILNCSIRIS